MIDELIAFCFNVLNKKYKVLGRSEDKAFVGQKVLVFNLDVKYI
ncbi:MAG: hypothetical protein WDA24_02565 [Tissierellales bacterium]